MRSPVWGDEFAIFMPNTSKSDCLEVCIQIVERIATEMSMLRFDVTASVGAMTFNHPVKSNSKTLKQADQALYQTKEKGRNCADCAEYKRESKY